jgi:putative transposase
MRSQAQRSLIHNQLKQPSAVAFTDMTAARKYQVANAIYWSIQSDYCSKQKAHAADILDNKGGKLLLENLNKEFSQIRYCWADKGYRGDFPKWCKENLGWTIEIVKRSSKWEWYPEDIKPKVMPRFTVLKRRWVIERTIGWLGRNRRMSKDYEFLTQTSESFIYAAMSRLMLKRLTKGVEKQKF